MKRYQPQRDEARELIEESIVGQLGDPETQQAADRLTAVCDAAVKYMIDDRINTIKQAVEIARQLGQPDVAHTIETGLGAGL